MSQKLHRENLINNMAIMLALVKKGVLSTEEFDASRKRATYLVDQMIETRQREQEKKYDKENPGLRDVLTEMSDYVMDQAEKELQRHREEKAEFDA